MATEATTWVSLERMKRELRLPLDVTDQDTMLVGHIDSAVRFVENEVGIPLLDRTEVRPVIGSGGNTPIYIGFVSFLKDVTKIAYWVHHDQYQLPDSTITQPFETRALYGSNPKAWNKAYWVLPPSGGFQISATGRYEVTIESGMNPAEHSDIVQILIVIAREFYQGTPQVHTIYSRPMFDRLLEPLYSLGAADYGPFANNRS